MNYHKFTTAGYNIVIVGNQEGLSQLMIDNNTKPVIIKNEWNESEEYLTDARVQLEEFYKGERANFDLKLNPQGTKFQKECWNALQDIPYGELYTYKDIACKIGNSKASRAVGLANNRNPIPIIIPCHRVIGSNKNLVGYAYGLEMKKDLINLEKINYIFNSLSQRYGDICRSDRGYGRSWWPGDRSFEVMVGAILTQNTNWKNVEKALHRFDGNLTPEFILSTSNDDLAEIIRPSGYQNQKAQKLKNMCQWFQKYDFDFNKIMQNSTSQLRNELLDINGIGGETADSILVYALNKASFVIDAYTRRILYRVGIDVPNDYESFRMLMEKLITKNVRIYDYYHGLLVEHAKAHCNKTPNCQNCPLDTYCEKRVEAKQKKLF